MYHADYQNPFESVKFISCLSTDQIGAFPYRRHFIDTDTELACFLPVFQILGCVKLCMVARCQNKAPAVLFVIPEDAWITEIRCARVFDHRVAIIFFIISAASSLEFSEHDGLYEITVGSGVSSSVILVRKG